jgi:hypothetical protein
MFGGSLNLALSFGIAFAHMVNGGGPLYAALKALSSNVQNPLEVS